jgi:uncharacterized membrane protein
MRHAATESRLLVRRFLVLALSFGALYAIVTPGFSASQEPEHFLRAYALSRGQLRIERDGEGAYGAAPDSFATYVERYGRVHEGTHDRVALSQLARDLITRDASTEPTRTALTRPLGSPFGYAAVLPAIWLARVLDLPVLGHVYLARFASVLAFALLGAWGLTFLAARGSAREQNFEALSWVFLALALTPALLAQAASLSPDGLTLGLSFLFFASLARGAFSREHTSTRIRRWRLIALFAALVACEPCCLSFALTLPFAEGARPRKGAYLLCAVGAAACALLLARVASEGLGGLSLSGESAARLRFVLGHPLSTAGAFMSGVLLASADLLAQMLVVRDGLSQQMRFSAGLVATLYGQLLLLLTIGALHHVEERTPRSRRLTASLAAALVAYLFAVCLTAYLKDSALGAARLVGLYGRAFLPAAPLALIVLASLGHPIAQRFLLRSEGNRLRFVIIALNALCLLVLFGRYYAAPTWPYLF